MTRIQPIICAWRSVDVIDTKSGEVENTFGMVPIVRHRNIASAQYEIDAEYPMMPFQNRSKASHNYYHAALGVAFENLPEGIAVRWPSVNHFRKWLLVETNWYDEKEWTFEGRGAEQQARRLGAFIRTEDEYARISVTLVEGEAVNREHVLDRVVDAWQHSEAQPLRERLRLMIRAALGMLDKGGKWKVLVRRAKSQDHASMDKDTFQKSSKDVLELASQLTKVPVPTLVKEGQRHHA